MDRADDTGLEARCPWAGEDRLYRAYHDAEWGRPVGDERLLFEKLCLEGFQAGLSWITILRKRERFREVFHGFDPERVAAMDERDVERLLGDPGIIRHRGKIEAAIANAKALPGLVAAEGSLASLVWRFEPQPADRPAAITPETLKPLTETAQSRALSKALRGYGFRFVGPTTCYAFMQAMGIVNDHLATCSCRAICETEREAFVRPVARK